MVERNLAKVEVGSSRLLSRSRIPGKTAGCIGFGASRTAANAETASRFPFLFRVSGGVAEWSCSGLQSRLRRFDSDPRLHILKSPGRLPAPRAASEAGLAHSASVMTRVERRSMETPYNAASSPDGEIGRHKGLKIPRRVIPPCRFESGSGHQRAGAGKRLCDRTIGSISGRMK